MWFCARDQMHVKSGEVAEGGSLFSAELLSSSSKLLSPPLDEPLMRSFTGGEKKARGNGSLFGGGVDEIITQLSYFLSGQRLVPVRVRIVRMCVFKTLVC